ncbi:MAG: dockerin type I repeat-containing protein [Ruminococcus sp.]|nr:dockerin type I repeat-containing protein [Ruminococcus sp.]
MKKISAVILTFALLLTMLILPANAQNNSFIYVDLASLGWKNASLLFIDVTDYELEKVMGPALMYTYIQPNAGESILQIDMSGVFSSMTEGSPCRIVMKNSDNKTAAYPLMIDPSCAGDTIKATGSTVRRFSSGTEYMVYWEHQDPKINGPAIEITNNGTVYGECFPYPAYDMLVSYINKNINSFNGYSDEDIQLKIFATAESLGLSRIDAVKAIKESDLSINIPDLPVFDDTPQGRFKNFLFYELEDARKSGKSDQEILDEKAEELGLLPYQIYTCLEDLGIRDQVNWDFKLWYGSQPTFKGQFFSFGLTGWLPAIPGEIAGSVTYNSKGLSLAEGLKEYPVSGIDFAPASEEYGSLYDVSYTFSEGRVDFSYTLKDQAAAKAFFGIGHGATDDEVDQTRLRMTLIKGAVEVIADEGRYDLVSCEIEIKDTNGNWLYKDHQSTVSGYGIQSFMPMGFVPSPEDYIDYQPEYLLGDADSDGVITVMDATSIQKYKASLIEEEKIDLKAADADHDGVVTVLDATRIQKYKAKLMNMDGSVPYREN